MGFCKIIIFMALATLYVASVSADENAHDTRSVFGLIPSVVPCNFTQQGGSTCPSCNQSLYCFSNNVGLQWNCGGLWPNCNNGRCSAVRPENCTSA